ncbi:putative ABC-type nitrate/sulfonate/bicarbonate transport system, permease component [Streptomyces himastatinicus ATCC 53653]|uniref:Putative ABC-type nitrate/sulfonate/bicarbonate transport system, permease component n=1 Tax=Streptomyces himastatinicus ATCC 53653 TaxID=457427 RepID=D9W7M8_9ACTN|nr:ABC transporter permease [Streptomyces himastatinicus]EFL28808.1 putative ABC-type nitrate/sulfonate/bicarbonate transport system, permease component [Streptomyces himastatinicus ATCC 53653]
MSTDVTGERLSLVKTAPAAPASPAARRERTRRRLGPGRPIPYGRALGPVLLLAIWSGGSATGLIDARNLSAPWTVVATAGDLIADGRLQTNVWTSAELAVSGLAYGVAAGLVLALIAGLSRLGEGVIDGPVQIKRGIPTLALIPLLILWFGIGESMKVITIALSAFVPVYIHTHNGLRTIDARYVELAETLGLSRPRFLLHIVLPGALPGFLLGMRFAVTAAWLALAVVEQVNATSGIGYMTGLARTYGQTDIIIVGLVVYGLLGLLSDGLVRLVERKVLSWRRTLAD